MSDDKQMTGQDGTMTSPHALRERAAPALPRSLDEIVANGLCIGCGLCASIAGPEKVRMTWTEEQRLRPLTEGILDAPTMDAINACCPGVRVAGLSEEDADPSASWDPIWGWLGESRIAWAGDPELRHLSSTGGALNALSIHLLERGDVNFILHVGPDPEAPARSIWRISRTANEIRGGGGSRYGPTAPLEGIAAALALNEPFAFVGKPCDVSALRLRAQSDPALAERCRYRLALVCGGQSEFRKTANLLREWDVPESTVATLRYRGLGNPGPTTVTTRDGSSRATTYQELWEDESTWALPHRCKICPDAIGMAADIIAADCWPGGGPTGEDEGFNAVGVRTPQGRELFASAVAAGHLVVGDPVSLDDWADFQPHQVRKRRAVWARLAGQRAAGIPTLQTEGLGIDDIARGEPLADLLRQARGTRQRITDGKVAEPPAVTPHGVSSAPTSNNN